jgi:hypothetical protein
MEFQKGSGALEVALLLEMALGLDFAELVECLSELAGEPLRVHAEGGEGAVGVDDIEADGRLLGGWVGGAVEQGGFKRRDAVEAPRRVGELLGELSFGGSGGLILVEELAAVLLVGDGILCSEDGGAAGGRHSFTPLLYLCSRQRPIGICRFGGAVGDGVLGRTLFAGGSAGSGGEKRIRTVRANPGIGGLGLVIGVGIGFVIYGNLRCGFSMGGWRFRAQTGGCCWVGGGDGCGSGVNGLGHSAVGDKTSKWT